jgi:hypothetical protein
MAMEVHPKFGDVDHLVTILRDAGFQADSFDYDRRMQPGAPDETRYILAWRQNGRPEHDPPQESLPSYPSLMERVDVTVVVRPEGLAALGERSIIR